jgi:ankyrin repeat protein
MITGAHLIEAKQDSISTPNLVLTNLLYSLPDELLSTFILTYLTPRAFITIMPLVSKHARGMVEEKYAFIPKEGKSVVESGYPHVNGLKPKDKGRELFFYYFPEYKTTRSFNIYWSEEFFYCYRQSYHSKTEQQLFTAVKENDLDTISRLLKEKRLEAFFYIDTIGYSIMEYAANNQSLLNYFYQFICEGKQFETKVSPLERGGFIHAYKRGHQCYSVYIQRTQLYWAIKCRQPLETIIPLLEKHSLNQYFHIISSDQDRVGCMITPLHLAAVEGNIELVRYFIQQKGFRSDGFHPENKRMTTAPLIDYRLAPSQSLLFYAMKRKHIAIFKYLVEKENADIGMALFQDIIRDGQLPLVKYVIERKKTKEHHVMEPLVKVAYENIEVAYENGYLEIGDILFDILLFDADIINRQPNMLMWDSIEKAFETSNRQVLEIYIKRNFPLFSEYVTSWFSVHSDFIEGRVPSFLEMLIYGASFYGKTHLNRTAGLIIELLTEQPTFNLDFSDAREGMHPLDLALCQKEWDIAEVLLNARVTLTDKVLDKIERLPRIEKIKFIKILLKNYSPQKLLPILINAINKGQCNIVAMIINKYPYLFTQSLSEEPSDIPLVLAAKAQQNDVVSFLTKKMSKKEIKSHEINIAYVALLESLSKQEEPNQALLELIPTFIKANANIYQVNSLGQNALILAIKGDDWYIINCLLAACEEQDCKDINHEPRSLLYKLTLWGASDSIARTPLYWVIESGLHYNIMVSLLLRASKRAIEALGVVDENSDKFKLVNAVTKLAECKLLNKDIIQSLIAHDQLISAVNHLAEKNNLNEITLSRYYQRTINEECVLREISQAINQYSSENKNEKNIAGKGLLKELNKNKNNLIAMLDAVGKFLSEGKIGNKPESFFGVPRPHKKLCILVAEAVLSLTIPENDKLRQLKDLAIQCISSKELEIEPAMPMDILKRLA